MISHPPEVTYQGRVTIAWPTEIVLEGTAFVGFLMPWVSGQPLIRLTSPPERQKYFPGAGLPFLVHAAGNLARLFAALHEARYVAGDVKQMNFLADGDSFVAAVDTDSFQVTDSSGYVHRCEVLTPEYTPPEMLGKRVSDTVLAASHDLFGLAALIFELLMAGEHPFRGGVPLAGSHSTGVAEQDNIRRGISPFFPNQLLGPKDSAPPLEYLDTPLQRLFKRAFQEGLRDPTSRPNAVEWVHALAVAEKGLARCVRDRDHFFWRKERQDCVWCEIEPKRQEAARILASPPRLAALPQTPFVATPPAPVLPHPVVPPPPTPWTITKILVGIVATLLSVGGGVMIGLGYWGSSGNETTKAARQQPKLVFRTWFDDMMDARAREKAKQSAGARSDTGGSIPMGRNGEGEQGVPVVPGEWTDNLAGNSIGRWNGIRYVSGPFGTVAEFRRSDRSQIEYPGRFPNEGTLEIWIYVESGYGYQNSSLTADEATAVVFSSDNAGLDVAWPGAATLRVSRDGSIEFTMSTAKYGHAPNQTVKATQTSFRFNAWHSLGVSWGSAGQCLFLDGGSVADAPKNTQRLGAGGTHERPEDVPTIGETVSRYWAARQHVRGFEGRVARVRVSANQRDWKLAQGRPFEDRLKEPTVEPTSTRAVVDAVPTGIQTAVEEGGVPKAAATATTGSADAGAAGHPAAAPTSLSSGEVQTPDRKEAPSTDPSSRISHGDKWRTPGERRLSCEPSRLKPGENLTLVLPRTHGRELAVRTPDNRFLVIAFKPESGAHTSHPPKYASAFLGMGQVVINSSTSVGVDNLAGRLPEPVFTISGTYEFSVSENLDSEDEFGSSLRCSVYFATPSPLPTPRKALVRPPADWKN